MKSSLSAKALAPSPPLAVHSFERFRTFAEWGMLTEQYGKKTT